MKIFRIFKENRDLHLEVAALRSERNFLNTQLEEEKNLRRGDYVQAQNTAGLRQWHMRETINSLRSLLHGVATGQITAEAAYAEAEKMNDDAE